MGLKTYCLLLIVLVLTNSFNFCEVQTPEVKLFTSLNQLQQVSLDKYIRGFDLEFDSSKPTVVSIFEPYHVSQKSQVTIKAGYSIVNVDSKASYTQEGILFAVGEQKGISVGYGVFSSGVLPKVLGYNYFELPYASNCYSGLIYNENLDIVIDCEKITAVAEQMTDLVCLASRSGKEPSCTSMSSITQTSKRKSLVLTLGQQKYFVSAALTNHISRQFQNQTFINIYYIGQKGLQFNLIIDRRSLGLDSLSITDIDIVEFNEVLYLMLTDANSRLIAFRYTQDNQVQNVMIIAVPGIPRQFVQSEQGTWLIATEKYIWECTYLKASSTLNVLRKYELDPADNQVTDLQSSYLFISVRTFLGNLYTYDRKYTELKYLLNRQQITENTMVVVSPFYPRLFQINNTQMVSIAISSGSLFVAQLQQSTDVLITATSGKSTCNFNLHIELIKDDANKIYQKQSLTSSYRLESGQTTAFTLSNYFGGSNLKYTIQSSPDIDKKVQHVNKYTQKLGLSDQVGDYLFSKIVQINANSYWLTVFTTQDAVFYKCNLNSQAQTSCTQTVKQRINPNGLIFENADGLLRQNDGKAYISWTYKNNNQIVIKQLGNNNISVIFIGQTCRFSQVLVGEKYFVYIQKQLNRISFYDGFKLITFTKNDFTADQLAQIGDGFYPRQVFDSHKNPHIFYIKFPIAVVTVSYSGGRNLQIVSYTKVSDSYVPDNLWSMVIGRQTILLFTPVQVAEYVFLADAKIQKLHKIPLTKKALFPIRYQLKTDTAYFECDDGTIQYIRLNQPALDSQYYALNLANLNGANSWDVSGSWLITNSGNVYYQYQEPTLMVKSVLSDTQYRKDLNLSIKVSNEVDSKDTTAKVTAFNYPVQIQASSAEDNGLILPESGDNQIIPFPLGSYFVGSVASYTITCGYCLDGTLKLLSPIRQVKQNQDLNGFTSVIGLLDNSGSVVLLQNNIKIVDLTNNIIFENSIQTDGECTSLGITQNLLAVFCAGSNQQILLYTLTSKSIKLFKRYLVPADSLVLKPSQIGIYKKADYLYILIHDVDLNNPVAKDSNIKIFELGDTIIQQGRVQSSTFQIANTQPINSMSISGSHVLVTIGKRGLGYLNLAKSLSKGYFINLETQPALANYTLDDTSYLRVIISSVSADVISALVTTSNSFNYVLELKLSVDNIAFSKILQTYKRYGHQKSINWGLIDDKYVMLSFYNKTTTTQTLALYKRNTKDFADFFASIIFTIPYEALRPPKSVLLHYNTISATNSFLFLNSPDKPATSGGLTLYNITQQYSLFATYQKPSSFDIIDTKAYNDYYSASRELKVQFEGTPNGVKWYSIVIAATIAAIAIGIAFGLYLKMKRKKVGSKKVSLYTENEEIDEQV